VNNVMPAARPADVPPSISMVASVQGSPAWLTNGSRDFMEGELHEGLRPKVTLQCLC
jgi:hypothetical protein